MDPANLVVRPLSDPAPAAIPLRAGVGLKARHYREILETRPDVGWFEVHAENFMGEGGPPHHYLRRIRAHYALSLHSVGLSLGSAEPPCRQHLSRLKALIERYDPGFVSDHLSWSGLGGVHLNDLLPLPYSEESLAAVCRNVIAAQEFLARAILIENPSRYLDFEATAIPEPEFLNELARRSGCGILLDVNNVYVSAINLGFEPEAYIDHIDPLRVCEIHLAGHAEETLDGRRVLLDDHGSRVCDEVWQLYAYALERISAVPTLIEWDTKPPSLDVLLREAAAAERIMARANTDGGRLAVAV